MSFRVVSFRMVSFCPVSVSKIEVCDLVVTGKQLVGGRHERLAGP